MEMALNISEIKLSAFRWRDSLSITKKCLLALGMACLIGLAAQIRIVLPWSPVPITGQTFAVLLAGILLGRWWGGVGVAAYAVLGVAGIPWFAGWGGGLSHLAGPSGGYIIGFILAALFLGYFTDTYAKSRKFVSLLLLMLFANFILIYIPGLIQLGLWFKLVSGEPINFTHLIGMGAVPFIAGDIAKAVAAAVAARAALPKCVECVK